MWSWFFSKAATTPPPPSPTVDPTGLFDGKPTRVVISGSRCTGKTVLAKHLAPKDAVWITSFKQLRNATDGRTAESKYACFVVDHLDFDPKVMRLLRTLMESHADYNYSIIVTEQYVHKLPTDCTFKWVRGYTFNVTKGSDAVGDFKAPSATA
jgi:hypothetical protein